MAAKFDPVHMYTYLKGYAAGKGWPDVLNALAFARKLHEGQFRKDGQPYIVHPLAIACHAVAIGIDNSNIVASCILHDVCEDCGVTPDQLPVSERVRHIVTLLTHKKGEPLEPYYRLISEDPEASIVKVLDRCDNVSTMSGVFTVVKTRDYIKETRTFTLPLIRSTKDNWPVSSNVMFILKYHVMSVIDSVEAALNAAEEKETGHSPNTPDNPLHPEHPTDDRED